jgi:cell division protein FtsL
LQSICHPLLTTSLLLSRYCVVIYCAVLCCAVLLCVPRHLTYPLYPRSQDIRRKEAEFSEKAMKRRDDRKWINLQIQQNERTRMLELESREQENVAMRSMMAKYKQEDGTTAMWCCYAAVLLFAIFFFFLDGFLSIPCCFAFDLIVALSLLYCF